MTSLSGPGGLDLDLVRRALARVLPGPVAQAGMAPAHRPRARVDSDAPWREAAVIIALYPGEGGLLFPLTLRTEDIAHHKGQISLPGGAREAGETLSATALREAWEEVGIDREGVEILGRLSPLEVPPSGFRIQPFVAALSARPVFRLQKREVAELIEVRLSLLLDPGSRGMGERSHGGSSFPVPLFRAGAHEVWGATAMILAELAFILERELEREILHP